MKYRLIREYPDSPELGIEIIKSHISNSSLGSYDTYMIKGEEWFKLPNPENYPEFWQLVVEKDYEILSLRSLDIIEDLENNETINMLLKQGCSIHSVKRLSDSIVFKVGDEVLSKTCAIPNKILSIELINNKIRLYPRNSYYNLKDVCKAKQKLFTTEDGVDIFEGDTYWCVNNASHLWSLFEQTSKERTKLNKTVLSFSTKEKAKEYILMNKPCLSLNDIFKDVEEMRKGLKTFENSQLAKRFKKLVQQKLNK